MGQEQVALIAGGSKGLGKMTALALAKMGYHIVIHYHRNIEAANDLILQIHHLGQKAVAIRGDVTDQKQVKELFQQIEDDFGRLDILVHSVGPFIRERKTFYQMTIDEINGLVQGNLMSAFYTTSLALSMMRKQRFGRIIYFGFNRANEAPAWPDRSVYTAAKVALVSFTKSLATEEAPYGITVNMVCPGDIIGYNKERFIQEVINLKDKESLIGRPGSGEDVTRVIQFLCQKDSEFITGNIINISGGLDIIHPTSKVSFKDK